MTQSNTPPNEPTLSQEEYVELKRSNMIPIANPIPTSVESENGSQFMAKITGWSLDRKNNTISLRVSIDDQTATIPGNGTEINFKIDSIQTPDKQDVSIAVPARITTSGHTTYGPKYIQSLLLIQEQQPVNTLALILNNLSLEPVTNPIFVGTPNIPPTPQQPTPNTPPVQPQPAPNTPPIQPNTPPIQPQPTPTTSRSFFRRRLLPVLALLGASTFIGRQVVNDQHEKVACQNLAAGKNLYSGNFSVYRPAFEVKLPNKFRPGSFIPSTFTTIDEAIETCAEEHGIMVNKTTAQQSLNQTNSFNSRTGR